MQINILLVKITFEFNFILKLSGSQSVRFYCGKMGTRKKSPTEDALCFPYFSLFFFTIKACDDLKKITKQNCAHCFHLAFPWVSKLHLFHVHWIQQEYSVQDDQNTRVCSEGHQYIEVNQKKKAFKMWTYMTWSYNFLELPSLSTFLVWFFSRLLLYSLSSF